MTALARDLAAPGARPKHAFAGALLGWLAGSVLRIRRVHVEAAMARAGVDEPRATAAAMYRRLGAALVELLTARSVEDPGAALSRSLAAIDDARAKGPVVLFASHVGNWELVAAAASAHLREQGSALRVVAKPMHSAFFDRWLRRIRAELGVAVIAPEGALAVAATALERGEVVALPIDQVPASEGHGTWLDFLGARALVDRAPATLAYRMRATVLVIAGDELLDVIPAAPSAADRGAWVLEATRRATAALEAQIQRDPASWMWLHRRWKRPPPRLVADARAE